MKDWLNIAQDIVDESSKGGGGSVRVRYNDLIDAIAKALEHAANPVNISDHDPWMRRLATRLADIDIRLRATEELAGESAAYIARLREGAAASLEKFHAG